MFYIGGVDEAGRGPVLGPMVMSIVAAREIDIQVFNRIGVKDSKMIAPAKRVKLARIIRNQCPNITIKVSPKEIDKALRNEKSSLNVLEAKTTAKLITQISKLIEVKEVMLDLPAKNKEEYLSIVHAGLPTKLRHVIIKAEFKADMHYAQVSAASILAKVARDASIKSHEKRLGIKIGSGYPADPYTVAALDNHFTLLCKEGIVREEWKTVKNLKEKKSQARLGDF